MAFLLSSLVEGARRVKTCRTEEEIRETRRILAAKRDPRRGEQHGRVIRTRASVGNSGKEVTDHLEKLIDDIEISTARYERSPPLITTKTEKYNEDIPHIFTRRHHSNNKWRKARIRKHKHNKGPKPSNAPTNIQIFTHKKVSNLKQQNENNINGQTKTQSVITESLKGAKLFEDLSRFPFTRTKEVDTELNENRQPLALNPLSHSPINQEDLYRISRKILKLFNSEYKHLTTS